jgi:hypothetical protein
MFKCLLTCLRVCDCILDAHVIELGGGIGGSHITASVDGAQIIDVTDGSFSSGWAGVWATADATTQFDNVRIENAVANP